jgi:16S rRNA (guanine966-N2)-methyltransferase
MRIVSGRWRGRVIKAPADSRVRPTADRVREAWMSIFQNELAGARIIDLFAGSGALGLEALSRGAEHAHFVELGRRSLASLGANIQSLGAEELSTVHRGDAVRFVAELGADAYDIAFADPPYGLGMAQSIVERWREVPFAPVLAIEHPVREIIAGNDRRVYGDTAITILRAGENG